MSNQVKVKFRRSAAIAVAAGITVIGAVPLLAESVWFLLVLLVPLAITIWAWRAGTDVDQRGFTVRALLGSRTVPWNAVDGLVSDDRTVLARLANGAMVPLDAVRPSDLPRVVQASGQELPTENAGGDEADDAEDEEAAQPGAVGQ
ncbi:PH domain-containing protein [Dactylosporangium darangshiense]|uniref:Low molecular weight protein antigen 6 PH domain-containing protein n=1 Tax=Dactylosporangium darangshiense TaxID=579108 RepID=A0ABP8D652_9ACTN